MTDYGVDALAFGAHPDDVELFCGGTLIRLAELGYATGVVDLTRGEKASNGSAPGAMAAIEARDRYYGSMIGTAAGEPLRSPATPGLVDPIRHFRDNPFPEAHAFEPLVP